MKLFKRENKTKSLASFASSSSSLNVAGDIEKITGGTMAKCHNKGGNNSLADYQVPSIFPANTGTFNMNQFGLI